MAVFWAVELAVRSHLPVEFQGFLLDILEVPRCRLAMSAKPGGRMQRCFSPLCVHRWHSMSQMILFDLRGCFPGPEDQRPTRQGKASTG